MNTVKTTPQSALNHEKAQKVFPRSYHTLTEIFQLAGDESQNTHPTMDDLADDPVAGREWMKKYQALLKKTRTNAHSRTHGTGEER